MLIVKLADGTTRTAGYLNNPIHEFTCHEYSYAYLPGMLRMREFVIGIRGRECYNFFLVAMIRVAAIIPTSTPQT